MTTDHISPEIMAALVDGDAGPNHEAHLKHIARCHRCAAYYGELVGRRAEWLRQGEEVAAPDSLVQLGLSVPSSVAARTTGVRRRRTVGLGLAAATAALVVVAGIWWWQRPQTTPPPFVGDIVRRIDQQMTSNSSGVAYSTQVSSNEPTVRSGSRDDELSSSLAQLADYYNNEAMTADVAYWLIGGYIATGQMRNAEVYLDEALDLFPGDARVRLLAGILAYKQSDLIRAEREFRAAIEANPDDGVALFNLGVVLVEQGRREEAEPILSRAERLLRGTPLADRVAKVSG